MSYLVAALCLGAVCALWALLQRGSPRIAGHACGESEPDCTEDCSQRDESCPSAAAAGSAQRGGPPRPVPRRF